MAPQGPSLETLRSSWRYSLRAANKSPKTVEVYEASLEQFIQFLVAQERPTHLTKVRRADIRAYLEDVLGRCSAATASVRFRALQQFFKWAVAEEELDDSPMKSMSPPVVPEKRVPVLTRDEIDALLKQCAGSSFESRRDTAIIQMLADTGMRRAELCKLRVEDIDLEAEVASVIGKGRRPRLCPFSSRTTRALDRYFRVRAQHSLADDSRVWLGRYTVLTENGLGQMLRRRGREAGIANLHAHRFRHTFAHEWLSDGGSEGGLMRVGGWRSRSMLDRYGASAADQRGLEEYRRLRRGA